MISVIVPTLNEERNIARLLDSLCRVEAPEVIVVDGGSGDRTVELAKGYPVQLVACGKNRALQMNRGAEVSRGDTLLFLHADCTLEEGSLGAIERAVREGYAGGCLTQRISSDRTIYRSIERSGNLRAKWSKVFYGDQAIFVRSTVFSKLGGFDEIDLFEDVEFSKKLRSAGKVVVLDKKVYTSPRRWEAHGVVKATLINWLVSMGFVLGISPARLKKIYRDMR
jgi:rSAM/selenodomain-associated transferase 2